MTVKLLKQSILGQRRDHLMVSLDDTGYYYTRHWNISSTMFVMLLMFVLCILLQFCKNTQLATVGTHYHSGKIWLPFCSGIPVCILPECQFQCTVPLKWKLNLAGS